MSTIKKRTLESALRAKGFCQENTHHEYFWLFVEGKKTRVRTYLSHGIKEYEDNLLSRIAKQLHVNKLQLIALVECPLSYRDYVAYLQDAGHIQL